MNVTKKLLSFWIVISLLFSNCQAGAKLLKDELIKPLNVILLIGDGMGLAQICAASVINGGLTLEIFENIGFIKTSSSDDYITDSAAGATAFSTGEKTYNGAIGLAKDSSSRKTIVEMAETKGLATGLISTCSVTHATPASFFAHQLNREMHLEIANDFYGKGIDFVAGTGKPYFNLEKLILDGYKITTSTSKPTLNALEKNFWFYNDSVSPPKVKERGNWLAQATEEGMRCLSNNKKGFFLMVEGSQIDWGGHDQDIDYVTSELIDFDQAVLKAYEYAKTHPNTLIIVTADHETGGLTLNGGSLKNKSVKTNFAHGHHSGIMVPVFAFGPGSHLFRGTYENTEIFRKIKNLMGLQ
ncbi:MAG: alkaline phosphatase [Bacteroidota bacterium]|nr:alkaline phosphatase [Bacteroidota bacterium]